MKSHLISKLYVLDVEVATGLLATDVVLGGAGDKNYIMSIAGNIKCFSKSNFRLDICDPGDRAVIVRCMLKILKYIESDMRN